MKNWIMRAKCFIIGHKVTAGAACPVTGIVKLECDKCDASNMPKHKSGEMSFR